MRTKWTKAKPCAVCGFSSPDRADAVVMATCHAPAWFFIAG